MKRFLCLVTVLLGWAWTAQGATTGPAAATTLRGTFVWSNKPNDTHDLVGRLTPTGPNEWQVVWEFKWSKKPTVFRGKVTGSLQNGAVSGTGDWDEKGRKFTFDGTAKDGVITINHYEVTKGRKATGTGELRVAN